MGDSVRLARRRLSVIRGDRRAFEHRKENGDLSGQKSERKSVISGYGAMSHVGYVPYNPNKVNQDRAVRVLNFGGDESKYFFGCFDGHGQLGHEVSQFVSTQLPRYLLKQSNFVSNPYAAITQGFLECNAALANSSIDCTFSGTTAIVCYLWGRKLYSCNAGDSRAVLARRVPGQSRLQAIPLSDDQKPDRPSERKRILASRGRVEACKGQGGEDIGPQRVWLQHQDVPGLAMTRSFGDLIAASVGVVADPEIWCRDIHIDDRFMILGSDGIWKFISNQDAVNLVDGLTDPQVACRTLVDEATRRWQQEEEVIDDITCMLIYF